MYGWGGGRGQTRVVGSEAQPWNSLANAFFAVKNSHELHDSFQELPARSSRGAEDDHLAAQGQGQAGAEDGDAVARHTHTPAQSSRGVCTARGFRGRWFDCACLIPKRLPEPAGSPAHTHRARARVRQFAFVNTARARRTYEIITSELHVCHPCACMMAGRCDPHSFLNRTLATHRSKAE